MTDIKRAVSLLLQDDSATCVLVKGDDVVISKKRGVSPLVDFVNAGGFEGYSAADKIVGRAAAMLYVLLKVKSVYACVASGGAADIFRRYGIDFSCGQTVEKIVNRNGDGICPMEQAVAAISHPNDAFCVISAKLAELSGK